MSNQNPVIVFGIIVMVALGLMITAKGENDRPGPNTSQTQATFGVTKLKVYEKSQKTEDLIELKATEPDNKPIITPVSYMSSLYLQICPESDQFMPDYFCALRYSHLWQLIATMENCQMWRRGASATILFPCSLLYMSILLPHFTPGFISAT